MHQDNPAKMKLKCQQICLQCSNINLVPRSFVDEAEGEIWPTPICITWSPVRNVTGEASAHAQHKSGAVKAKGRPRPILSHTTSLRQAYDMTWQYSLESLNFIAFTKRNKHKMRSKGFFYNLAGFVFEYFCDSRRILATFAKFCLNSLFRNMIVSFHTSSSARAPKLPSIFHTSFLT